MLAQALERLAPYYDDETIGQILINGHDSVYVVRTDSQPERVDVSWDSEEDLIGFINKVLAETGHSPVDESNPIADVKLSKTAHMNVVIPPIASTGPSVTIRRYATRPIMWDDIVNFGSLDEDMSTFLKACVQGALNICVSGGLGSGKTTLYNGLTSFIPEEERVVVLDGGEVQVQHEHLVMLEGRAPDANGRGGITLTDLVINAIQMLPDRFICGEVRGQVMLDLLQAMNIGMTGMMFMVNALSVRDALSRMEIMATMHFLELPLMTIRDQMGNGLDLIVVLVQMPDGKRRIIRIAELDGVKQGEVVTHDIFEFVQTGMVDGELQGHFRATGYVPRCLAKLRDRGVDLPETLFQS